MRHGDALVTPRSDAMLRPSGAGRRYPLSRVTNQPADAAPIASDSTAALGKRGPVAFGENGPGLACGAQGIWPGPCSVGDGSIPTVPVRPDDACPMLSRLARPCAEPGRRYSAAPRPSVRRLQSLALMRRSGLHVAAHWASATFMDNSSCRSAAPRRMQLNGRRPVRGEWA
jgi:hypothetical protein